MKPVTGEPKTLDDIIKGPKDFYDPNIYGDISLADKQMNQFMAFSIVVLAKEVNELKNNKK